MKVIGGSMVIYIRKRKGAELIFFKFNRYYLVAQGMSGWNQRIEKN